jgi:hypothetical protein
MPEIPDSTFQYLIAFGLVMLAILVLNLLYNRIRHHDLKLIETAVPVVLLFITTVAVEILRDAPHDYRLPGFVGILALLIASGIVGRKVQGEPENEPLPPLPTTRRQARLPSERTRLSPESDRFI